MAKEMTQEEREQFFEEPKGVLGKAVSDEQWDMAMGHYVGPFNENMTVEELLMYAKTNHVIVSLTLAPSFTSMTVSDCIVEEGVDGGGDQCIGKCDQSADC